MTTSKKTTLAVLAVGAGLAFAPSLYAQDTSSGSATSQSPGGMGMGQGGMMGGEMSSMMKMMENCNRMMQSMNNQSPQTPSTPPAAPGQRG